MLCSSHVEMFEHRQILKCWWYLHALESAIWPPDKITLLLFKRSHSFVFPLHIITALTETFSAKSKGFREIIDPLILIDQLKRVSNSRVTSSRSLYITRCQASTVITRDWGVSWRWAGQAIGHLQSGKTVILLPLSCSRRATSVVLNLLWLWKSRFFFFFPKCNAKLGCNIFCRDEWINIQTELFCQNSLINELFCYFFTSHVMHLKAWIQSFPLVVLWASWVPSVDSNERLLIRPTACFLMRPTTAIVLGCSCRFCATHSGLS